MAGFFGASESGAAGGMVFVGHIGEDSWASRMAQVESSKSGVGGGRVGGDADAPALIEDQGRAEVGGVEDDFGDAAVHWPGPGGHVAVGRQQVFQEGLRVRMAAAGRCSCTAPQTAITARLRIVRRKTPPQFRVFHFNSDGCQLQAGASNGETEICRDTDSGEGIGSLWNYSSPSVAERGGY